jgi:hypothetical protein
MQELGFLQWAKNSGVQPTDSMRNYWVNPRGYDTGGEVGGGSAFPHPLDPNDVPAKGLDFLDREKMVQNILASYDRTVGDKAWLRQAGLTWYQAARDWVQRIIQITGRTDIDVDKAASIVAQLSENTDWFTNMQRGMGFFTGKTLGKGQDIGMPDQLADVVKRIAASDDPLMAGRGQKIYNFLRSILGGERFPGAVAVDRWADRIALGVADKPELWDLADKIRGRGKYRGPLGGDFSQGYDIMADAYREAAARRGVLPAQMQAVTWVADGPVATDPTIKAFQETGEWRFPITNEEVARLAHEQLAKSGGVTIDLSGTQAQHGFAWSPSKKTESMFAAENLTREDILRYIEAHQTELRKGMFLGLGTEGAEGFMDISRVDPASVDVIAKAQKAKQVGVWDFDAPEGQQWVTIGDVDEAGKYTPTGAAADLFAQHQAQVQASRPRAVGIDYPAKPTPGLGGPGAAMAPARTSVGDALSQIRSAAVDASKAVGRGAGTALDAAAIPLMVSQTSDVIKTMPKGAQGPAAVATVGTVGTAAAAAGSAATGLGIGTVASAGLVGAGILMAGATATGAATGGGTDIDAEHLSATQGVPIMGAPGTSPKPGLIYDASGMLIRGPAPGHESGGLVMNSTITIHHADGSPPSTHEIRRLGPNNYESVGVVPLLPGDEIYMDGKRVR